MSTLPLSDIVNISVVISPVATMRKGFNLGLIVGTSAVIPVSDRLKIFTSINDMTDGGFTTSMPEYKAATLYFSQNPKPSKLAIGRWDNTGEETALEAITSCREKNSDWYACYLCGAVKDDIEALSPYFEAVEPASTQFYTTSDADVLAGTDGNVMKSLQALGFKRSIGQYSTYPDAAASIMGYAMGANTGLANTAYTLAYKQEVGVIPEVLTENQVMLIKGQNGNVYINRGNNYNLFEQGIMANGMHFDEVLNLDMLVNDIRTAVMDLLVGISKVPQTEGGVTLLITSITGPCESALTRGFLAPGVWNAPPIMSLSTGDSLSKGYIILSESIANQSEEDRANRIAPPIYVCLKLAGAIEFVAIQINVNR
ncbi:DUF3383 family protein [Desulfosporosinus sp. PR]|uniref:DUF3383 family protein n=1 Tax=Candidatus Desulfosporosinus nitrosoreducens TaxID=3401928 RepID=UPI0027F034B6|nr:DUF3383 family protein [Desulfosporosinus sp. PR]MDQ7094213.1 DUF3383 family protein [Desulfosporosinus sp. PR]